MSDNEYLKKAQQFGEILIKKSIINRTIYEKAWAIYLENDLKERLNEDIVPKGLSQILVEEFNADSDMVYHETAEFYAFYELDVLVEDIPDSRIKWMRDTFSKVKPSIQEKLIKIEFIVYMMHETVKNRFILLAVNPTSFKIPKLLFQMYTKFRGFDIIVIKKKEYEKLINIIKAN